MKIAAAIDFASHYASREESDWNRRYVHALSLCGFIMIPWSDKKQRPKGAIDAPIPVGHAPGAWLGTHIIIEAEGNDRTF